TPRRVCGDRERACSCSLRQPSGAQTYSPVPRLGRTRQPVHTREHLTALASGPPADGGPSSRKGTSCRPPLRHLGEVRRQKCEGGLVLCGRGTNGRNQGQTAW